MLLTTEVTGVTLRASRGAQASLNEYNYFVNFQTVLVITLNCKPTLTIRLLKARLQRPFLSHQPNATQCNFCRAEVATSCDFIASLVQFVRVNVSTRLLLEQQLCAC